LIERKSHGCYRLNLRRSQEAKQLIRSFLDNQMENDGKDDRKGSPAKDMSLNLFAANKE